MRSAIDSAIYEAVAECVAKLGALNDDTIIRRAIMEAAVRDFAWEMLEVFDDQYALADQLDIMTDAVRKHKAEAKT